VPTCRFLFHPSFFDDYFNFEFSDLLRMSEREAEFPPFVEVPVSAQYLSELLTKGNKTAAQKMRSKCLVIKPIELIEELDGSVTDKVWLGQELITEKCD